MLFFVEPAQESQQRVRELGLFFAVGPVSGLRHHEKLGAASQQTLRLLVRPEMTAKVLASRDEEAAARNWPEQAPVDLRTECAVVVDRSLEDLGR